MHVLVLKLDTLNSSYRLSKIATETAQIWGKNIKMLSNLIPYSLARKRVAVVTIFHSAYIVTYFGLTLS